MKSGSQSPPRKYPRINVGENINEGVSIFSFRNIYIQFFLFTKQIKKDYK